MQKNKELTFRGNKKEEGYEEKSFNWFDNYCFSYFIIS